MSSLAGITLLNVPASITLPVSSFQPIKLSHQVMVTSDPGFGPLRSLCFGSLGSVESICFGPIGSGSVRISTNQDPSTSKQRTSVADL